MICTSTTSQSAGLLTDTMTSIRDLKAYGATNHVTSSLTDPCRVSSLMEATSQQGYRLMTHSCWGELIPTHDAAHGDHGSRRALAQVSFIFHSSINSVNSAPLWSRVQPRQSILSLDFNPALVIDGIICILHCESWYNSSFINRP
jgi:hypothetical protein